MCLAQGPSTCDRGRRFFMLVQGFILVTIWSQVNFSNLQATDDWWCIKSFLHISQLHIHHADNVLLHHITKLLLDSHLTRLRPVCGENILYTITTPAAWTVDTRQVDTRLWFWHLQPQQMSVFIRPGNMVQSLVEWAYQPTVKHKIYNIEITYMSFIFLFLSYGSLTLFMTKISKLKKSKKALFS